MKPDCPRSNINRDCETSFAIAAYQVCGSVDKRSASVSFHMSRFGRGRLDEHDLSWGSGFTKEMARVSGIRHSISIGNVGEFSVV